MADLPPSPVIEEVEASPDEVQDYDVGDESRARPAEMADKASFAAEWAENEDMIDTVDFATTIRDEPVQTNRFEAAPPPRPQRPQRRTRKRKAPSVVEVNAQLSDEKIEATPAKRGRGRRKAVPADPSTMRSLRSKAPKTDEQEREEEEKRRRVSRALQSDDEEEEISALCP